MIDKIERKPHASFAASWSFHYALVQHEDGAWLANVFAQGFYPLAQAEGATREDAECAGFNLVMMMIEKECERDARWAAQLRRAL